MTICWVASGERTVKTVWENNKALQVRFSSAAHDVTKDLTERAKHMLFSPFVFIFNCGIMYDTLTELSDLSRMLRKRDMMLPEADKLLPLAD